MIDVQQVLCPSIAYPYFERESDTSTAQLLD